MKTTILARIFSVMFGTAALVFSLSACTSDEEDQQQETLEGDESPEAEAYNDEPAIVADSADSMEVGANESEMPDEPVMDGIAGNLDQTMPVEETPALEEVANQEAENMESEKEESFEYSIQKGDWLSKIAERVYGDMYKWPMIANANPQIGNPNLIFPGRIIKIPVIDEASRQFSRTYTASVEHNSNANEFYSAVEKPGTPLSKIAKSNYGQSGTWNHIFKEKQDRLTSTDHIAVGQTLKVAKVAHLDDFQSAMNAQVI